MTLFFVGYLIAVTSTIAFIVVILTPKWIYPNNLPVDANNLASPNERNYRGIFYVDEDSVDSCRPPYTVACASLAIIALSLSIILLWLAGGYLYIRRRRLMPITPPFLIGKKNFAIAALAIYWYASTYFCTRVTIIEQPIDFKKIFPPVL
ncbi:unnamed protein product [Rotaria socialis]